MNLSSKLELRELTLEDEKAFLAGYKDWASDDVSWYTSVWKPGMTHSEHLAILQDQKDKNKIPETRVPSTMLYGFVRGEIVGRLNLRHELNAFLLERGGHIGYAVSVLYRKKGYASQMFVQGLAYCRKLGLQKVLITCADDNIPSMKIIENFGGSFENRIFDVDDNELVRRYWINLEASFHKDNVVHKAIAYVTRRQNSKHQLLVFEHDKEFSDAGIQVPCGTVDDNEDPKDTIIRELFEEAGIQGQPTAKLDEYQFYGEHAKKFLRRHVFHFEMCEHSLPQKWTHQVSGEGHDKNLNFHYSWIDIEFAKGKLSGRFDDSIDLLLEKLRPK